MPFYIPIFGFPADTRGKNPLANAGDVRDVGSVLGLGRPLEKEMAAYSSILTWRIPWIEEPESLQSIGSQRVRHDLSDSARVCFLLCRLLF